MQSYVSYGITFVKIKGFLWHGTESDWQKCYVIWVNKATYNQTLFHVLSEKVSTKSI